MSRYQVFAKDKSATTKRPSPQSRRKRKSKSRQASTDELRHIPRIQRNENKRMLQYMFEFRMGAPRRRLLIADGVFNYSPHLCRDYDMTRRCENGNKCIYSHGSQEKSYHPLLYKTSLCNVHARTGATCSNGAECTFAHGEAERRDLVNIFGVNFRQFDPTYGLDYNANRQDEVFQQQPPPPPPSLPQQPHENRGGLSFHLGPSQHRLDAWRETRMGTPTRDVVEEEGSSGGQWNDSHDDQPNDDDEFPKVARRVQRSESGRPRMRKVDVEVEDQPELSRRQQQASAVAPTSKPSAVSQLVDMVIEEKTNMRPSSSPSPRHAPVIRTKPSSRRARFSEWFSSVYSLKSQKWSDILERFQEKDFDDLEFLCSLYQDDAETLRQGVLKQELLMTDRECSGLMDRLLEYLCPKSLDEFMTRIVGLPQYVEVFEEEGIVLQTLIKDGESVLDTLKEIGVESVGHRLRIKHYLAKMVKMTSL